MLFITYQFIIDTDTFVRQEQEGISVINSVDNALAQQIVNTVKDVCGYDINFIRENGEIFASTNPERIGTFHEIGRHAASSGSTIEVNADNSFPGTQQGINLPVYHNGRLLAVIGITGTPGEVRKYAHLAERITKLLIREKELNAFSRSQADRKNYIITTLIREQKQYPAYLNECLKEFGIDPETPKRFLVIQINPRYNLMNLSLLEQKIGQMFTDAGIELFTFSYPREFLAVIEDRDYRKNISVLENFSRKDPELFRIAAGKSCPLFHLYMSYSSARTALRSIEGRGQSFVSFDDLTLEIIVSSTDETSRKEFLRKTVNLLSEEELNIIEVYFSEDMSLANTSGKLYIHKNTLQYKLNHIHEKSGLNPRRFQDAVLLYLALRIRNLQDLS